MAQDDWQDVPLDSGDDWQDVPVSASTDKDISGWDSAGRGAVQGLSFGFGDEIKGFGKSAIQSLLESLNVVRDDGKSFEEQYTEARDADRLANRLAEEANPGAYMTGDIGTSVALGLLSGGAGLAGAVGKTGLKEALKAGGKKALLANTAIGMTEGAAHGLGRSEADLTEGEVLEAAKDTGQGMLIGAAAPAALKLGGAITKGTAGFADDVVTSVPGLGKAYTHIKDVAKEGAENLGQSLDETFVKVRDKFSGLADDITGKRKLQDDAYAKLLAEGQDSAATGLKGSVKNLKNTVDTHLSAKGDEIGHQVQAIDDYVSSFGSVNNNVSLQNGDLVVGKFNFEHLVPDFDKAIGLLDGSDSKILAKVRDNIQNGNFSNVHENLKLLNGLVGKFDGDPVQTFLIPLKDEVKKTLDTQLRSLPGEQGKVLYGKLQDLNKDYSLLKNLENVDQLALGANQGAADATLGTKASIMAEPGSLVKQDVKEALSNAYQTGSAPLIEAADDLTAKGAQHNKMVFHAEKGKMGLGPDEQLSKAGDELFGKLPTSGKFTSEFTNTIEELNKPHIGLSPNKQQQQTIDWIRQTYGDKADSFIEELKKYSQKHKTLSGALDTAESADDVTQEMFRFLKKISGSMAYKGGQLKQKAANTLGAFGEATGANQLNVMTPGRTAAELSRPKHYKQTVEEFKNSQNQGADSE